MRRDLASRRSTRRAGPGNASGFTLVELVVIIGIILVLLGLVVPSVGAMFQIQSVERTADIVSSACHEARARSIRTGRRHYVAFIVGRTRGAVAVYSCIGGASGNRNPDWQDSGLAGTISKFPAGVLYAGTETRGSGTVLSGEPGPIGGIGGNRIYLPGVHRYADGTVSSNNRYPVAGGSLTSRTTAVDYTTGWSGITTSEDIYSDPGSGHTLGETVYDEGRDKDGRAMRYFFYYKPDGSASGSYRIILDTEDGTSKLVQILRVSGQAYVRDCSPWEYP